MIDVRYFATIREFTGKKEERVETSGNLLELMLSLCNAYGKNFRDFCMTDDGHISKNVNILVNGKHFLHLDKEKTTIHDNDEVSIFPLIGGG